MSDVTEPGDGVEALAADYPRPDFEAVAPRLSGSRDLEYVSEGMRRRERKSYVFLALLVGVAVGAVGAGVVADSEAFWAAAGTVVVMAAAGIVAYAASGLGVFAQMIDLIRGKVPEA